MIDTDVVVAALRSPLGASAELLRFVEQGRVELIASVPIFVEYEAVVTRAEHLRAAGISLDQALTVLDALALSVVQVVPHFRWRPQLRDPDDEMVLEAAANAQARAIVTFNRRDFRSATARFSVDVWLPSEAVRRVRDGDQ